MSDHDLEPVAYKTTDDDTGVVLEPALATRYRGDVEPLITVSDLIKYLQSLKVTPCNDDLCQPRAIASNNTIETIISDLEAVQQ